MKSKYLPYLLLLAVLPVLIFRDYTPDNELRYLSIIDEALRNGNIFTFTNQGVIYADKPPLYFWIIMLGKWLLGNHYMWFLGLFSFIPALVIMGTMDKWVSRDVSDENRLSGKLMLMTCGLFLGLAVTLRMDMLMCMFITLSLYTFYKMLKGQGSKKWNTFLFPFYVFMAVFSKGPVGILIPLLTIPVFLLITGRIRTIGRYWGWKTWGILLIGCALWFGGVYWEAGPAYLDNLLFHQTVNRAVNSFHHEEPFYYYFISMWYSLAPWSLLLIGVILAGVFRRLIRTDLEHFFLTILLVTIVMLSCISSKIAIYLIPAFPFFVYLAVMLLSRFKWNGWLALTVAIPAFVFVLGAPALIVLAQMKDTAFLGQVFFYIASALLSLSGILCFIFLYRERNLNKAINSLAIGLFCTVFVGGWSLPAINVDLGYAELCRTAMKVAAENGADRYCTYGVSRPESMDVYLHQDINKLELEDVLAGKSNGAVLMVSSRLIDSDETLRKMFSGKERVTVGTYSVIYNQEKEE